MIHRKAGTVGDSDLEWPSIGGQRPTWTGRGFELGNQQHAVLDYEAGESGWSDDLTLFHEQVAGDGLHPIDIASRRRARRVLRQHLEGLERPVLLDVGCSSGFLLSELVDDWPRGLIVGADYIAEPLRRLANRLPMLPLVRFDLVKCPLPSESFDGIVLLNVLEHIQDDLAAMTQIARLLKPGGVAVIEVPARPELYDAYDRYLRHFRRYRMRELCHLVQQAGLRVAEWSHLGFFVLPAFAAVKLHNRRALNASEEAQKAVVERSIARTRAARLITWTTQLEEHLGRWLRFPVGIRCVITAMKP